jgi:ribosomal protein S18 acetylase RimI-like enzyme
VTHPNDLPPFYEEEPSKIDNEHNVKCKVIVGGVVFESTNSRGYLEEGWWRSVLGENANSYYIMTIGVIEEYRKQGIAQMLLDAVEKAASL